MHITKPNMVILIVLPEQYALWREQLGLYRFIKDFIVALVKVQVISKQAFSQTNLINLWECGGLLNGYKKVFSSYKWSKDSKISLVYWIFGKYFI